MPNARLSPDIRRSARTLFQQGLRFRVVRTVGSNIGKVGQGGSGNASVPRLPRIRQNLHKQPARLLRFARVHQSTRPVDPRHRRKGFITQLNRRFNSPVAVIFGLFVVALHVRQIAGSVQAVEQRARWRIPVM